MTINIKWTAQYVVGIKSAYNPIALKKYWLNIYDTFFVAAFETLSHTEF